MDQDIEEFYAVHARGLVLQLYAYTDDLSLAQDLVQEAFCRALPRWDRIKDYDDPAAWLRRVAWNLAASRFRRARTARNFLRRQRVEYVAGPSPDRVALAAALAKVPENQRRALVLYYLADQPAAQIAQELGASENTVRMWLHRGRAALAAELVDTGMEYHHG